MDRAFRARTRPSRSPRPGLPRPVTCSRAFLRLSTRDMALAVAMLPSRLSPAITLPAGWRFRQPQRPAIKLHPPCRVEPKRPLARLIFRVLEGAMSERRITQLFGLILGAIFTFGLVLNAFAF